MSSGCFQNMRSLSAKCRLDGYHIGIAKCIHFITQDHTDTELPSRFPRPFYNWPLLSAEGEGAVCNEVSCTPLSTGSLYPKFQVQTSGIIQKLYETKTNTNTG